MTRQNEGWQRKDDLDLTSEDLSAMLQSGDVVELVNVDLPPGARLVMPSGSFGVGVTHVDVG